MIIVINLLGVFVLIMLAVFLTRKIKGSMAKESEEKLNALRAEWTWGADLYSGGNRAEIRSHARADKAGREGGIKEIASSDAE